MNNNSVKLIFAGGSTSLAASVLLPYHKEDTYRVQLAGWTDAVACKVIQDPSHIGFFQRIYHALFSIEATAHCIVISARTSGAVDPHDPANVSFTKTVKIFINKNSLEKRIRDKRAVAAMTQTLKASSEIAAQTWSAEDEQAELMARPKLATVMTPECNIREDDPTYAADRVYSLFFMKMNMSILLKENTAPYGIRKHL